MKLKNVVVNAQPSTTLYREEIEALLEVLDKVFYRIGTPKHGTFLLWGVADGSYDVHKFISFDFEKGHKKHFLGQDEDSRTMAEWILSQDAMREEVEYSAVTNMYSSPYYLSINSTFGRFTCAFFADNGSFAEQILVYIDYPAVVFDSIFERIILCSVAVGMYGQSVDGISCAVLYRHLLDTSIPVAAFDLRDTVYRYF